MEDLKHRFATYLTRERRLRPSSVRTYTMCVLMAKSFDKEIAARECHTIATLTSKSP